jgi:hypothetical protein
MARSPIAAIKPLCIFQVRFHKLQLDKLERGPVYYINFKFKYGRQAMMNQINSTINKSYGYWWWQTGGEGCAGPM